jgi:hypothetical protein
VDGIPVPHCLSSKLRSAYHTRTLFSGITSLLKPARPSEATAATLDVGSLGKIVRFGNLRDMTEVFTYSLPSEASELAYSSEGLHQPILGYKAFYIVAEAGFLRCMFPVTNALTLAHSAQGYSEEEEELR